MALLRREAPGELTDDERAAIVGASQIGRTWVFERDPRFGLVVLSEIASRALSPAVNDPGTAIDVTGTLVRLFVRWHQCGQAAEAPEVRFDRIAVPELALRDLFENAFSGIARDGAGTVEVAVRLLKALEALAMIGDAPMQENARRQSRLALARSEEAMTMPHDVEAVRDASRFAAG